jgi:predicted RNase H-like nuclease
LSQQCFAIVPKIAEVDQLMTPQLQRRVVEVHPEVSFAAMNGDKPLALPKKESAGRAARMALLDQAWGLDARAIVAKHRSGGVQPDDILDALVACWTAERVLRQLAQRFPKDPMIDSRGLRMEIVR